VKSLVLWHGSSGSTNCSSPGPQNTVAERLCTLSARGQSPTVSISVTALLLNEAVSSRVKKEQSCKSVFGKKSANSSRRSSLASWGTCKVLSDECAFDYYPNILRSCPSSSFVEVPAAESLMVVSLQSFPDDLVVSVTDEREAELGQGPKRPSFWRYLHVYQLGRAYKDTLEKAFPPQMKHLGTTTGSTTVEPLMAYEECQRSRGRPCTHHTHLL
jgi:hypothetical protein